MSGKPKININKEKLLNLYESDKNVNEIADYFNCSVNTLRRRIKKFNIPLRIKRLKKPIKGDRFNKLIYVEKLGFEYGYKCKFLCDCGNIVFATLCSVSNESIKSCGCYKRTLPRKILWRGYGDISGKYWNDFKRNAIKYKHIEFNIDIKYAWDIFLKQKKRCALSGLELTFKKNSKNHYLASLDRINTNKGYIEGNIQWVVKEINYMKKNINEKEFINVCKLVDETNF